MIQRAILVAFDATGYTATIRPPGSAAAAISGVPVSRALPAGEMVAGRQVAVAGFAAADPTNAVVLGVWV